MIDAFSTMSELSELLLFNLFSVSFVYSEISAQEGVKGLMDEFRSHGYEKRRRQIASSIEKHDKQKATLDNLPEVLPTLIDGSNFLQYSSLDYTFITHTERYILFRDSAMWFWVITHKVKNETLGQPPPPHPGKYYF